MTQLLLPGEVRPTAWQKVKQTVAAFFQPGVYVALKNAETSSRNTVCGISARIVHKHGFSVSFCNFCRFNEEFPI